MNAVDLELLRALSAGGDPVPAAELAERCGIPAQELSGRLDELTRCGFVLERHPHRGVRRLQDPPHPVAEVIRAAMPCDSQLGRDILVFRETSSTNDVALRLGSDGAAHGTVVVAESQTGGRGRHGRVWHSKQGGGLWISVLLRPDAPPSLWPGLALAAGCAVAETAESLGAPECRLKWPNDVVVAGRKIAGILLESRTASRPASGGFVVVGIGLNLEQRDFPEEIAGVAISLPQAGGCPCGVNAAAPRLLSSLEEWYGRWSGDFGAVVDECNRRDALRGQAVHLAVGEETVDGTAWGIGRDGALVIRLDDGSEYHAQYGEATFHVPHPKS